VLGPHPPLDTPLPLMEVMPALLAKRTFSTPFRSHAQLAPGYKDAPGVEQPLAIVFVKVWRAGGVAAVV
jgi:hypothetical protein